MAGGHLRPRSVSLINDKSLISDTLRYPLATMALPLKDIVKLLSDEAVEDLGDAPSDDWADEARWCRFAGLRWWTLQKRLPAARVADLEAYLARAAAMAEDGLPVLLTIEIPKVTQRTSQRLLQFAQQHLVSSPLAIVITSPSGGHLAWDGRTDRSSLQLDGRQDKRQPTQAIGTAPGLKWTAIDQWLLKVLLLRDVNTAWWGGPRQPVHSIKQLAELSSTAYGSAHKLWAALDARGWAGTEAGGALAVSALGDLVDAWLYDAAFNRRHIIPVRPLYDLRELPVGGHHGAVLDWLASTGKRYDGAWAVGGWMACNMMGVIQVTGNKPVSVTVAGEKATDHVLDTWGLQVVQPEQALLFLHQEREERPMLLGRIRKSGIPHVDIWQAALDVASDPARGREQADFIERELFGEAMI